MTKNTSHLFCPMPTHFTNRIITNSRSINLFIYFFPVSLATPLSFYQKRNSPLHSFIGVSFC